MNEPWDYDDVTTTATAFPWPPTEEGSVTGAIGATWKDSTFDPGAFFRQVPRASGTGPAILYYLVLGILVAGASLFWQTVGQAAGMSDETMAAELGVAAVQPVVMFLLSPVLLLAGLALTAGVVHLLLLIVGGASHGFGTTVRVFCYAYSPMIFGVVPVVGTLVGSVWMVVISIIGLREGHATVTWKPALAVLLPLILLLGLMALAFMAVLAGAAMLAG